MRLLNQSVAGSEVILNKNSPYKITVTKKPRAPPVTVSPRRIRPGSNAPTAIPTIRENPTTV